LFYFNLNNYGQSNSVTDADGNTYNTVVIGSQVWLKEELKSLHYSDGSLIPGAQAYGLIDAFASTYGRLYTWYDAMKNSTTEGAQGACPSGWHIPTDTEWTTLITFLGGESAAGGHLKEAGTTHWNSPNTGADNSSGFTSLPGGVYFDNAFRYLRYNVEYWSSTNSNGDYAFYRILYYDTRNIVRTDYFNKSTSRSIRCIYNGATEIKQKERGSTPAESISLFQNYPNPFNPTTTIRFAVNKSASVSLKIYDQLGRLVKEILKEERNPGIHLVAWDGKNNNGNPVSSGIYYFQLTDGINCKVQKGILLK